MVIKAATPTSLKAINGNIRRLSEAKQRLLMGLKLAVAAHENREALKQKMYDDGVPGSNEPFVTPLLLIEDEADFLIQLAQGIKNHSQVLRNYDVDLWPDILRLQGK